MILRVVRRQLPSLSLWDNLGKNVKSKIAANYQGETNDHQTFPIGSMGLVYLPIHFPTKIT